ncbi:MAG: PilN domain-containing protein [Solirubrobacterales bacterium]
MKELNLIPPKYEKRKLEQRGRLAKTGAIVLAIVLLAGGSGWLVNYKWSLEKGKTTLDEKLARVSNRASAGKQLDYLEQLCTQREKTARGLTAHGLDVPGLMRHLEQTAPRNTVITNLKVEAKDQVLAGAVTGLVPTEADLASLLAGLEADPYFASVRLNTSRRIDAPTGNASLQNFTISVTINTGK